MGNITTGCAATTETVRRRRPDTSLNSVRLHVAADHEIRALHDPGQSSMSNERPSRERMNRTIKEATTVKRYHYGSCMTLTEGSTCKISLRPYNFAKRLKTPQGPDIPMKYICKIWSEDPDKFVINPHHHTTVGLTNRLYRLNRTTPPWRANFGRTTCALISSHGARSTIKAK